MKIKASKRFKKLIESSKDKKIKSIEDAIKKIKENCTTKFDESIDVSLKLNLKKKKEEITLRTVVNLPIGNGKKLKLQFYVKKVNHPKQKIQVLIYMVQKI